MKSRFLDTGRVLDGWSLLEPPSDFSARVLAAHEAPPKRAWHRWALAAALLVPLVPLLAPPRPPSVTPPAIARSADLDAGLQSTD